MDISQANHSIVPFLWFNNNLKEAIDYYQTVFKDVQIEALQQHGSQVFGGTFVINGQRFHGLNGGPMYPFTPAFSLFISCENQEEIDYYWEKLIFNGKSSKCGWLVDQFGLSWQVIPKDLGNYIQHPAGMQAMLGMEKISIEDLRKAVQAQ